MYQIGQVAAIPFIGPAIDTFGRRFGMFIAAMIIIIGVIIQGTTIYNASVGQFMGGRFLLGFGVGILGSAGAIYIVEISHPSHRGVVTGLYNVFWYVDGLDGLLRLYCPSQPLTSPSGLSALLSPPAPPAAASTTPAIPPGWSLSGSRSCSQPHCAACLVPSRISTMALCDGTPRPGKSYYSPLPWQR